MSTPDQEPTLLSAELLTALSPVIKKIHERAYVAGAKDQSELQQAELDREAEDKGTDDPTPTVKKLEPHSEAYSGWLFENQEPDPVELAEHMRQKHDWPQAGTVRADLMAWEHDMDHRLGVIRPRPTWTEDELR